MDNSQEIKIVEVGPRDGLQNEPSFVPTEKKIELVNLLSETGLRNIEVTSFVSEKWVPQLADHTAVFSGITKRPGVHYSALVPDISRLELAIAAGVKEVAIFTGASETFTQKNINCSIAASIKRFEQVMQLAQQHDVKVRGYISCVLGCPFEGAVPIQAVIDVAVELLQIGCYEISLGDTIGVGRPYQVKQLIAAIDRVTALNKVAVHFHDTYGQAIANIYAAVEEGIRVVDAAIAGLGGCPFAYGSSGNVATEDVVYLLEGMGKTTGVDLHKLAKVGLHISSLLNKVSQSKVANALAAKALI